MHCTQLAAAKHSKALTAKKKQQSTDGKEKLATSFCNGLARIGKVGEGHLVCRSDGQESCAWSQRPIGAPPTVVSEQKRAPPTVASKLRKVGEGIYASRSDRQTTGELRVVPEARSLKQAVQLAAAQASNRQASDKKGLASREKVGGKHPICMRCTK